MMILKVRALYKVIFENRFVAAFLRGTPGLEAWSMLGKAQYHAFEKVGGRDRYDMVILDAPATGHGLDLLRVPGVIMDVVPPGPLRKDAERAVALFQDPARSGVFLVTLAEELPTNETIELHTAVRQELGLPVQGVVVNRVLREVLSDQPRLLSALASASSPNLQQLGRVARTRAAREAVQQDCIERLTQAINAPLVCLPNVGTAVLGRKDVLALSQAF